MQKYISILAIFTVSCSLPPFLLAATQNLEIHEIGKIWEIGNKDGTASGMALAPDQYEKFIEQDFGFEDRFFLIGHSDPATDWPYILPGPANGWAGTGPTAGIRSHILHIDFELEDIRENEAFSFELDLLEIDPDEAPLLKVIVNGMSSYPQIQKKGPQQIKVPVPPGLLKRGFNEIALTTIRGGWLSFDQIRLSGSASLKKPQAVLLRGVQPADYELEDNAERHQPLLIDVNHLKGQPLLEVLLDGGKILERRLDSGRYVLEAPMPAVHKRRKSTCEILLDGKLIKKQKISREPRNVAGPADYVNTMMGAAHSRWMIAPGPWMPFGMVKLSPDNQNSGWQAGYDPTIESIGTFSHIHEWTMAGLGTFPVSGPLKTAVGDQDDPESGYRSRIDKRKEKAPLGYYRVELDDYNITAELTAATRSSFQRYTYHKDDTGRVMIDLKIPAEYQYEITEATIRQVGKYRIEGYSRQRSADVWSGGVDQDYTVYFVMEFDQPIRKAGVWRNGEVLDRTELSAGKCEDAGMFVEFDVSANRCVQLRTGISFSGHEQAAQNLEREISNPFGWSFDSVLAAQKAEWNELLGRVLVESDDRLQKERFYTNMYRSLASRNTFSDVDGSWVAADEQIRRLKDSSDRALGCDAFWNTFWNLNQFWNLVTPEWSNKWVRSQLAMYDANGWLAKGPAGMEYIPVMVAEHEIPLIVGAYQMGIRDYDAGKAFEAVKKMQTTLPEVVAGGYAGNRDLEAYLKYGYVPYDKGRFSNSLEYSFDDWTVGQFAKALGKKEDYEHFSDRGSWWKHAIDSASGFARMRDAKGVWLPDFDPFKSGANEQYVEGNAWQLSYFVPQDVSGLAAIIGEKNFSDRLEWGFNESYKWRFNGPNDQYWDYPVVQGNQQSMHFAFLFNWVKKPWLTQKWSRAVMERFYGHGTSNAYLGDEDQGQMSAWFVMNALGLFQTDGGTRVDPIYEIGSPIFERVTIDLGKRYGRGETFVIEAKNTSRKNQYIQRAFLNGKEWSDCWFPAAELLKGGTLMLEMGPEPNRLWGAKGIPSADY